MSSENFPAVPSGYPFPRLELEVLEEWRRLDIFRQSVDRTRGNRRYVFFEGPPTANAKPHVGHVVTRVIKDLFPRLHTMLGDHVTRKAGWDTHGLPVEIEVEKALGFSGKQDIEAYGVERFNRACLESVHTYEKQWREMTERIGFWIDLDSAYFTYTNQYIESVWWALQKLWKKGLLGQGYKIQPYCARCGTTLSSHEVAQNYKETDDPSVWVRFPVRPGQKLRSVDGETWQVPERLDLVAWTTTPWTLLGHSGIAASAGMIYQVVEHPAEAGSYLMFADGLEWPVPLEVDDEGGRRLLDLRECEVVMRIDGPDLKGLRYDRPFPTDPADDRPESSFDPPPSDGDGWRVFTADYVTASEGTGLVHTAPAFGEDDYDSGTRFGLPFFLTVDDEGKIVRRRGIEAYSGLWIKEADHEIVRDLEDKGRLLHGERYRHNYPFCWRCDQPLLYYASTSWFIRTTERKTDLIAGNQEIDWHPAHVKDGRFGNWLENMVDWALSRKRYWGTPLPAWVCDACSTEQVIGSFSELFAAAGRTPPPDLYDRSQFDPHRPFVDRDVENGFVWPCPEPDCSGTMGRVDEVIDAWFDSGSMPFAQHHYPFENAELIDDGRQFPADFIAEAVDQTRGWFYTLHVLGVLLFDSEAFKTCIVLGHVNDEDGRKMSKRLGNVVDPMEVIHETGADALRWYFCVNNPEINSRFSARLVREAAQNFLLPLWNALSFFTIYANLDGWQPGGPAPPFAQRQALDRWILLRLDRVIEVTSEHLRGYRVADAARGIHQFIDDLTNWYIRRSRNRFWASASGADDASKASAYDCLYTVLTTVARLIAPMTPFVAEVLHRHLVRSQDLEAPDSVHLEDWPQPGAIPADEELEAAMAAVQRIVRLGHAARNSHGVKTRQPLASVTVVSSDSSLRELVAPQEELLLEELNVREIRWAEERSAYVRHKIRPVYPKCGPRFGRRMPELKQALETADGDVLVEELEQSGVLRLQLDDETVELTGEEVEVRLLEREGTATQGDRDLLVALDTRLDDELVAEGRAREVVHRVQTARKEADLDYADRIRVRYSAAPELQRAIETYRDWISRETLAVELRPSTGTSAGFTPCPVDGLDFSLAIERVGSGSRD